MEVFQSWLGLHQYHKFVQMIMQLGFLWSNVGGQCSPSSPIISFALLAIHGKFGKLAFVQSYQGRRNVKGQ